MLGVDKALVVLIGQGLSPQPRVQEGCHHSQFSSNPPPGCNPLCLKHMLPGPPQPPFTFD